MDIPVILFLKSGDSHLGSRRPQKKVNSRSYGRSTLHDKNLSTVRHGRITFQQIGVQEIDMTLSSITWTGIALAMGLGTSPQLSAATVVRNHFSHGTANCQSALPVFDGSIRKRPMALANEGVTTSFVTCDSENINAEDTGFHHVEIYFRNRSGNDGVAVSCTLVDGVGQASSFLPRQSNPVFIGGTAVVYWDSADNEDANFGAPAISCALPAGVDITVVAFAYSEEVGN
jgi:hypothetical protein